MKTNESEINEFKSSTEKILDSHYDELSMLFEHASINLNRKTQELVRRNSPVRTKWMLLTESILTAMTECEKIKEKVRKI